MKKKQKVSVIIPTYNSSFTLLKSIKTLLIQTIKPIEIVVINNASGDETKKLVKKNFPGVHLINLGKNTGVTGGRNKGIDVARGDYILFFDHDMDAKKNMLEVMLNVAQSHPSIGIVTPKIYYWDNKKVIWSAGTDVNLWTGQTLFHGGLDLHQFDSDREVAVAPAVLLVKKYVIDKIGKFDPIYFATYEDTDFCFRAKKFGFRTYYASQAVAYHRIPYDDTDAMKRLLERTYLVARNRMIFMKRYGKNYLLFLLFIPLYVFHYAFLSIKFNKPFAFLKFLEGTVSGFGAK